MNYLETEYLELLSSFAGDEDLMDSEMADGLSDRLSELEAILIATEGGVTHLCLEN